MEIALIENVQREDLNPIEEAMAYQQLMQEFELTQEERLSVREVEKLVKSIGKPKKTGKEKEKEDEQDLSLIFKDLEERMKQAMGTKVIINKRDRNKGKIEIVYSEAELERLVELIESIH